MRLRNSHSAYGLVSQLLHWSIAGLIVYQFVLAERAEAASLFQKLGILATHKSIGITVLGLTLLRLIWMKSSGPRPDPPAREPPLRRRLARLSHGLLYALTLAMPLSGWLMSSATNTPVSYFGWLTLPDIVSPSQTLADRLKMVHGGMFIILASIVALHVFAALYHHFALKDDVLRRMLVPK